MQRFLPKNRLSRTYFGIPLKSLATDMMVAQTLCELGMKPDKAAATLLTKLDQAIPKQSAQVLYRYMIEHDALQNGLFGYSFTECRSCFMQDEHTLWLASDQQQGKEEKADDGSADTSNISEIQQNWKDIAEHILMDLNSFSKERGEQAAHMIQNLKEITQETIDYTTFLRKFAHMEERMQIDVDAFDCIFYTYGLQLYKRMPLIEPLEYKETYTVRDFVIAIDTSGLCSGDIVQQFLQKTYHILKESETLDTTVNIHIIQCDAAIQQDAIISTLDELDDYIRDLKLYGFGGTDFRPVFEYVEELIRQKVFQKLCGLIYFTDGYGVFPSRPPKYKTAFAFVEQEEIPQVPSWAMKLIWKEDQVYEY